MIMGFLFPIIVAVVAIAAVAVVAVANTDADANKNNNASSDAYHRGLQSPDAEFPLYLLDIEYEPEWYNDPENNGDDDACWVVDLSRNDFGAAAHNSQGMMMSECIEGISKQEMDATPGIISGAAILKGNGIVIMEQEPSSTSNTNTNSNTNKNTPLKVIVTDNSVYEIAVLDEHDHRHYKSRRRKQRQRRQLEGDASSSQYVIGNVTVLVVLVTSVVVDDETTGGTPTNTTYSLTNNIAVIEQDMFLKNYSMKHQFESCSHNQFIIEPAPYNTDNDHPGVMEVTIGTAPSNGNDRALVTEAIDVANTMDPNLEYSYMMVCLPPGSGGWVSR